MIIYRHSSQSCQPAQLIYLIFRLPLNHSRKAAALLENPSVTVLNVVVIQGCYSPSCYCYQYLKLIHCQTMVRIMTYFEMIIYLSIYFSNVALSAASFYVSSLPDYHQSDLSYPLHIYAGHIPSDPNRRNPSPTEVTPHIFFLLLKARRSADQERIIFWFNVRSYLTASTK